MVLPAVTNCEILLIIGTCYCQFSHMHFATMPLGIGRAFKMNKCLLVALKREREKTFVPLPGTKTVFKKEKMLEHGDVNLMPCKREKEVFLHTLWVDTVQFSHLKQFQDNLKLFTYLCISVELRPSRAPWYMPLGVPL